MSYYSSSSNKVNSNYNRGTTQNSFQQNVKNFNTVDSYGSETNNILTNYFILQNKAEDGKKRENKGKQKKENTETAERKKELKKLFELTKEKDATFDPTAIRLKQKQRIVRNKKKSNVKKIVYEERKARLCIVQEDKDVNSSRYFTDGAYGKVLLSGSEKENEKKEKDYIKNDCCEIKFKEGKIKDAMIEKKIEGLLAHKQDENVENKEKILSRKKKVYIDDYFYEDKKQHNERSVGTNNVNEDEENYNNSNNNSDNDNSDSVNIGCGSSETQYDKNEKKKENFGENNNEEFEILKKKIRENSETFLYAKQCNKEINTKQNDLLIRDYVNQIVDEELNSKVIFFLLELCRFQERLYFCNKTKFKSMRRYVLGLKSIKKFAKIKKLKAVFIAPNIEPSVSKGGLSDIVRELIDLCESKDIPVIFALSRNRLGRTLKLQVRQSAVGILSAEGVDKVFCEILKMMTEKKNLWHFTQLPLLD